jgi:hypothetical protein
MDIQFIQMAIDLAKTEMAHGTSQYVVSPETLLTFIEKTSARLNEIFQKPTRQ